MRLLNSSGQVLLEVALVLPLLVLGCVVFLYAFLLCRQLLALQPAAIDLAHQAATAKDERGFQLLRLQWASQTMGGRGTPPLIRRDTHLNSDARPATGFDVTREPARRVLITVSQAFWPHVCGAWLLPMLSYDVTAQVPLEPRVPEER